MLKWILMMNLHAPSLEKMMKPTPPSKALVLKVNLIFLALFLVVYAALLRPSMPVFHNAAASVVTCSLRECHHKVDHGVTMEAIMEKKSHDNNRSNLIGNLMKRDIPRFLNQFIGIGTRIGMINMEDEDTNEWLNNGVTIIPIHFEHVSKFFEWKDVFPEWIDEEEEKEGSSCPEISMPDFNRFVDVNSIVAKLPCKYPEEGWGREMFRLQVHLIAANMAAKKGKRDQNGRTKVVFLSTCRPMLELFSCEDLVRREGDWWFYTPEMTKLEQKVALPIGSCKLSLPLWEEGVDKVYNFTNLISKTATPKREAYATVLHSSESYVCGAITLAQSLLKSGTKRDLILLIDNFISKTKRRALARAGWKIRFIKRIRNPRAEKGTYNEYNYSKFRLWQLTDYDKVIFIDSDILVLRNLDILFHFPQISAVGNDGSFFNSGVMVIEPSNCTFDILMQERHEIISSNGGDQGYLNEIFVWWHRLPRRINFLKNVWSNYSGEVNLKDGLYGSDPPKLYAIHYLGLKPWLCYRDYDCNWDIGDQHVYASDVAHSKWWKLHDAMDESLKKHCGLTKKRKNELEWDRKMARKIGLDDEHCRINVTDPRKFA